MATSKTELLPLEGAISGIWRFFGFPAKDGQFVEKDKKKRNEVTCKLCFQVLKYASNDDCSWLDLVRLLQMHCTKSS